MLDDKIRLLGWHPDGANTCLWICEVPEDFADLWNLREILDR